MLSKFTCSSTGIVVALYSDHSEWYAYFDKLIGEGSPAAKVGLEGLEGGDCLTLMR